jgi:hypothetical protein
MAMPYIRIYGSARDSAELIGESHDALVRILSFRDAEKASAAFASHARAAYEQLAAEVLRLTKGEKGAETASSASPAKRKTRGSATTAARTDSAPRAGRHNESEDAPGRRTIRTARTKRSLDRFR